MLSEMPRYNTTIVAFIYKGGIIMAADTQRNLFFPHPHDRRLDFAVPEPGSFEKLIKLNKHVIVGSAGRVDLTDAYVRTWLRWRSENYDGIMPPTAAANHLLWKLQYEITIGRVEATIDAVIGGFEPDASGDMVPRLYTVNEDGKDEALLVAVGSGQQHALDILHEEYHFDMRQAAAKNLAEKALAAAAANDPSTGGEAIVFHIGRTRNMRIEIGNLTNHTLEHLMYVYAPDEDFAPTH